MSWGAGRYEGTDPSQSAEIAGLRAEIERLRKREAQLFEALQQMYNATSPIDLELARRTACEAIQQRAAGIGE